MGTHIGHQEKILDQKGNAALKQEHSVTSLVTKTWLS